MRISFSAFVLTPACCPFCSLANLDFLCLLVYYHHTQKKACFTHLAAQALSQFHEWRACLRRAWIWQQSWGHWRYRNNVWILVKYWWSWRSVLSHPESPVTAVSVYCLCRVHGWQCQNLGSPQLCWEWRETGWWRHFLLNGCPGYQSGGCPQTQPGLLNKACLSVVYDAEDAEFAQPRWTQKNRKWTMMHINAVISWKGEEEKAKKGGNDKQMQTIACFSPRKIPESLKDACGNVARESFYQHQLPNSGLLL